MRVLDGTVDKYGLNAYLYDSTDDATTNYDKVLLSPTKDGDYAVGDLAEGEWAVGSRAWPPAAGTEGVVQVMARP